MPLLYIGAGFVGGCIATLVVVGFLLRNVAR